MFTQVIVTNELLLTQIPFDLLYFFLEGKSIFFSFKNACNFNNDYLSYSFILTYICLYLYNKEI